MKNFESGQTLIIVLLVTALSLLVGVGVATRSASVVQQTTFSEEASQALYFAESCAEEVLGRVKSGEITEDTIPPTSYCDIDGGGGCADAQVDEHDCSFTVTSLAELFPGKVDQDDVAEVKLDDSDCTSVDVYWCTDEDSCPSSGDVGLEAVIIYDAPGGWETAREIYGNGPGFTTVGGGTYDGVDYDYSTSISIVLANSPKALRFITRYHGFHIRVDTSSCDAGFQGYDVIASGWFGKSRREVRVTKTEPAMPAIFDYAIFSGSETQPLEKN